MVYLILPINEEIKIKEQWLRLSPILIPNIKQHYLISNYGRIYNEETKTYLPKNIYYNKDKYITVSLSTITGEPRYEQIHRLVLITFNYIINYELYDVNHKDGIKYHNWLWNLEWCTKSENIQHAINNNLFNLGETRNNSILTNEQAHQICQKISEGKPPRQISNEMNLTNCNVSTIVRNILSGYSWKHISCYYDFSKAYKKYIFTIEQVHQICEYFQNNGKNKSYKDVLYYLGIPFNGIDKKELVRMRMSINYIRHKESFKEITSKYNY